MGLARENLKILKWAILAALILTVVWFFTSDLLTFDRLQDNRDALRQAVDDNYISSVIIYILMYSAAVSLSVPGAAVLTLAGGFLFGAVLVTAYVNIAATSGAVIISLLSRRLFGSGLQKRYEKQLRKFNRELEQNGAKYLRTRRLIPRVPCCLGNLFSGLTKVRFSTYLWTTMLGIIPGSFAYAYAGSRLAVIDSMRDVISPDVLLAFFLLGAIALVPVLYRRWRR
jgi:uncharacterized membrane protein YdjX (TVP38/TMEM64 family)